MRNEYLASESRILKAQVKGRLLLAQEEKATLAEIAHRLGRRVLEEVASIAQPDTILGWYRRLIANKCNGSRFRKRVVVQALWGVTLMGLVVFLLIMARTAGPEAWAGLKTGATVLIVPALLAISS